MNKEPHVRLRPLIRSELWKPLEDYLRERKSALITLLLTCSPEEVKGLQGSVRELDTLLNQREKLLAEEKSKR